MAYPLVQINLKKIKHNTKTLVALCHEHGIKVAGVTKVFCAIPEITHAMIEGGISSIADSRIENLMHYKDNPLPKILLRLPMICESQAVVEYADISLNSEIETIRALGKAATSKGIIHKIILMVDLGDLREGIWDEEELYDVVEETLTIEGVKLIGIGTNLTCYGGVIPNEYNLGKLVLIKETIEDKYNISLDIVSGGNSSSLFLVEIGLMPTGINQLRLGESIVLGRETAFGNRIKNTYDDAFLLTSEIIELKDKPSIPVGEIGMDAFGNTPKFEDIGIRKRAICAIGKQDVDIHDVSLVDKDIKIMGGSSDHIILDITDSPNDYHVGDTITFKLNYGGVLRITTSPYVKKVFIG